MYLRKVQTTSSAIFKVTSVGGVKKKKKEKEKIQVGKRGSYRAAWNSGRAEFFRLARRTRRKGGTARSLRGVQFSGRLEVQVQKI